MIRTFEQLHKHEFVEEKNRAELEKVLEKFAVSITPQMQDLIEQEKSCMNAATAIATNNIVEPGSPHHQYSLIDNPIAKQFLPSLEELNITADELYDPIADFPHTPVKGIVHRYRDRCLLKPVSVCAVYCRFCFRREFIGSNNSESLSKTELQDAYDYISQHKEIWEVILTGGDPLMLKPKLIADILNNLQAIPHVAVLRIHSRIPVVDSAKIDAAMIKALSTKKALYVVLHANHPSEFTEQAKDACHRIVQAGIPMLSQSVLLKGINDDPKILGELMRTFVENRIKPYYLHHPDMVRGSSHFRNSVDTGKKLMHSLKKDYSGLCQPIYVREVPGGGEKDQLF